MLYIIIGLSALFFGMAFFLTEKNSKCLLAGYNAMNEEERCRVNIKPYLSYFRKFHIFLGTSFFLIGLFLLYAVSENAAGIFMGTYPIAAYIYFIFTSSKYSFQPEKNQPELRPLLFWDLLYF